MTRYSTRLRLLPKEALLKTGSVDHADWNFKPILGWIQRLRFKLIIALMPQHLVDRILEVGYGSGLFMPELIERCQELYGIDIHPMHQEVTDRLENFHVTAHLFSGSAEAMPFEDQFFDGAIAISSLEFVDNVKSACQELQRVIKPGGYLVLVTPGHSPIVDFGLKVLTGESAKKDYDERRQLLIPTLLQHFTVEKKRTFPPIGSSFICLYTAFRLSPKPLVPN